MQLQADVISWHTNFTFTACSQYRRYRSATDASVDIIDVVHWTGSTSSGSEPTQVAAEGGRAGRHTTSVSRV